MTDSNEPASPPQMAASLLAATEAAGAQERGRRDAADAALGKLIGRVRGALERIDPADLDPAGVALIVEWHDGLTDIRRHVDEWAVRTGRTTALTTTWREDLRAQFCRGGLPAVLRDGTLVLEAIDNTVAALTDPAACEALERHRRILARILNAVQDRVDV
ncbi:hypothetical protein JSE7799_02375 [Jannaschia seosinensis]|uniref:Uncharacterized protein n=1 Tax=Jannaschia seosinensis TaxID=313367 RepID=A0A0M7BC52_9RHOB|nr:hypothetical protein [Jannaschia seosinensis]CUH39648.1 hypothetical protein JSE7799_02375 [Jannaschia seosinensis]